MSSYPSDINSVSPKVDENTRRQFLQKMLGIACATSGASLLTSCSLESADKFAKGEVADVTPGALFTENQKTTLYAIVDTILPRTDTPSASEVNCHGFIEHQLLNCHSEKEQQDCINIVSQIDKISHHQENKPFALLTPEQQQGLLVEIEQGKGFENAPRYQFSFLKVLTVFGYFTSEVGATQALNYQAVPGGFKGSIPCDENTKSWGSIDYY